jgi:hypothetical protein
MKMMDYLILFFLLGMAFLVIVRFIQNRRRTGGCASGCGGCPFASACSSQKNTTKIQR